MVFMAAIAFIASQLLNMDEDDATMNNAINTK